MVTNNTAKRVNIKRVRYIIICWTLFLLMKRCPSCNLIYDDTLSICIEDGSGLIWANGTAQTLVLPQTQPQPTLPVMRLQTPAISREPTAQRLSNRLLYGIILLLAIFAAGVTVALLYERDKPDSNANAQSTSPNTTQNQISTQQAPSSSTPTQSTENGKRYTVTSCGSVNDARTNLEWFVGPDRNTTWNDAQQWAIGLQACGGGWRMPTLEEIRALYDPGSYAGTGYYTRGQYWPAHMDAVFNGIGGGSWIWSDQQTGAGNARSFNMNQGKAVEYSALNTTFATRAFAVRRSRS